jgi:hypothetical protein
LIACELHLDHPTALFVASFIGSVAPRGGGTLILSGSPRLLIQQERRIPASRQCASGGGLWERFHRSHPWLMALTGQAPSPADRIAALMDRETIVDGVPLRVVELTGERGDMVFCHRGGAPIMILSKVADPRLVTIRRGGTLTDSDHHLLALWAATCAEHVLDLFELAAPEDPRPRQAIEHARAWVRGEVTMTQARAAGGHAMGAARDLRGAARHAAYAAGQAGAVAHVAAHELGAAAYAIKAARAAAPEGAGQAAGRLECEWQRDQLPEAIRELVLDDQRLRNDICWSVFS